MAYTHTVNVHVTNILIMFLFNRLAEHLQVHTGSTIKVQDVYFEYKEATAAEAVPDCNISMFARLSRQLFGCTTVVKRDDKNNYIGTRYIDMDRNETSNFVTLADIPQLLMATASHGDIHVTTTTDTVTAHAKTGVSTNGIPIEKQAIFRRDGQWQLMVASVDINLASLRVCASITWTDRFIIAAMLIVRKLAICHGMAAAGDVTLRHNVRALIDTSDGRHTAVIRSGACKRITAVGTFTIWPKCRSCQMATINRHRKVTDEVIELEPTMASDLGSVLAAVLSNASNDMKAFIVEQQRQLNTNGPSGRRWSKALISTCLSLWIRSPQGYQDLIDNGLVVLPSRSTLKI